MTSKEVQTPEEEPIVAGGEPKTISVELTDKTPLLMNAFTDAQAMKATDGTSAAITTNNDLSPRDQAKASMYIHEGKPGLPQPNVFRSFIDAGKFFKAGKSKVTTLKTSLVPSAIELAGVFFPIIHKQPWEVDTRPVRIPATGGRILRHRACFNDWKIRFELTYDPKIMNGKLVRDLVDAAGARIGLGDFRPDCKGPFGKFVVTLWKEV